MQTSLKIDDGLMAQLEREAARQGRTPSELLELALRLFLASQPTPSSLPPLRHSTGADNLSILLTAMLYMTRWKTTANLTAYILEKVNPI